MFEGAELVLIDNAETLAGKPATQRAMAQALSAPGQSTVVATNSDVACLDPLIHGLRSAEICGMASPDANELHSIAGALLSDDPAEVVLDAAAHPANVGELVGVLARNRARKGLL